jgi:hypothetical protein
MIARLVIASGLFFGSLTTAMAQGQKISAQAGIDTGGLVLGANFDFIDTAHESYGAYTRIYSKDRDEGAPAIFALGAAFRGRVKAGILEYYLSPGFGMVHYNLNQTELLLGPSLAYGVSAELDSTLSLGVENTKLYSWIGDVKGLIKDTFLATITFNLP